jgi:RimJ/RimL family protein N-acetyltransferase
MQKYQIITNRLGLRFVRWEDLAYFDKLDKDPKVKEFFPEGTLHNEDQKNLISECITKYEKLNLPCFVIFELESDKFVGRAYFDLYEKEVKVGYLFAKDSWSKGYASEVLSALLDWAKKHIDADYIIAYADKDNTASIKVLEKCGMSYYKSDFVLEQESNFYRIKNN